MQLARQMIAIPSPNFEEKSATDFMVERMRSLGLEVTTMDVDHPIQAGKKTRQAVGRLKGKGGGPTLMINGHLDVNVEMPDGPFIRRKASSRTGQYRAGCPRR